MAHNFDETSERNILDTETPNFAKCILRAAVNEDSPTLMGLLWTIPSMESSASSTMFRGNGKLTCPGTFKRQL
ncbi:hypothetical protein ACJ72_00119 [Emergomyces africanus]|uniref:Uncharacterized protein n=1 Tax=Emergomyces africanus TaxID=1955775 RepID=A0A1B7P9D7_9EURO|nr:hypothetical protein ACJ72_00119 [Emergomyces africanus]